MLCSYQVTLTASNDSLLLAIAETTNSPSRAGSDSPAFSPLPVDPLWRTLLMHSHLCAKVLMSSLPGCRRDPTALGSLLFSSWLLAEPAARSAATAS